MASISAFEQDREALLNEYQGGIHSAGGGRSIPLPLHVFEWENNGVSGVDWYACSVDEMESKQSSAASVRLVYVMVYAYM